MFETPFGSAAAVCVTIWKKTNVNSGPTRLHWALLHAYSTMSCVSPVCASPPESEKWSYLITKWSLVAEKISKKKDDRQSRERTHSKYMQPRKCGRRVSESESLSMVVALGPSQKRLFTTTRMFCVNTLRNRDWDQTTTQWAHDSIKTHY